jgi:hypothetical protein
MEKALCLHNKDQPVKLFTETIGAYCENHMKYTTTLCMQNAEFKYVKAYGI